jgi:phosphonate transport system ATP-binding protein
MQPKNIFELNEISKIYERKIALSSLSLNIKKGEIVALIGPSGSDKAFSSKGRGYFSR